MQKLHYIFIAVAVLLVGLLYFFGNIKGNKKSIPATNQVNTADHQHEGASIGDVETLDIQKYSNQVIDKLNASTKAQAETLIQKAEEANTAVAYKDIAEFWEKQKDLTLAANYYKKAAFLENTEKSITFAGNLLLELMVRAEDPSVKKWQALEAIECFEKAQQLNPNNLDTKIALATCYTEGSGETMKGVTLLREVTAKDSTNISANIILGKMAIQSGQLDKAVRRLELVLSLRPDNTEAMYFLAEAYKGQGNKDKAIELFEKCKSLVNNPAFSKEIDNYIKTFK